MLNGHFKPNAAPMAQELRYRYKLNMTIKNTFTTKLIKLYFLLAQDNIKKGTRSLLLLIYYVRVCACMVDPLSYLSFQPVLHDWCNKGLHVCYPVYGMMHIKE